MNWEAIGAIAEAIGGLGVILTLVYLSVQIRGSNRVAAAQARQAMSEFAMTISRFRAENADRYARTSTDQTLSAGDEVFLFWSHMQMMTYGEAYFRQFQLDLMPDTHWEGFSAWIDNYIKTREFDAFWSSESGSFSADYRNWIDAKMPR